MNKLSFTNSQWKTRKLHSFLYCALKHRETPHENDLLQYFFFVQGLVEKELHTLFVDNKVAFYRIFSDKILDAISTRKREFEDDINKMFEENSIPRYFQSLHKDICTPFLQIYSEASRNGKSKGSSYVDSVSALAICFFDIDKDFTVLYTKFENIEIAKIINNMVRINSLGEKVNEDFINIALDGVKVEVPVLNSHVASWHGGDKIFNEHFIHSNPHAPVFIVNSIDQACNLQHEYVRLYYKTLAKETINNLRVYDIGNNDNYDKVIKSLKYHQNKKLSEKINTKEDKSFAIWVSWFGGVNALSRLDLSLLKNRDVYWVYNQSGSTKKYVSRFLEIYEKINEIKFHDLQFIHVPEIKDKLNHENTEIRVWSPKKLLLEAFDMKIEVPEKLKHKQAKAVSKERKKQSQEDYIIYPSIRKKSLMILSAKAKHGKSYLGMALSYAAATKGKLFSNWIAKERAKVLYVIDREVDTSERRKREDIFNKIFKPGKRDKSITFEPVFGFNLYEREYQKQIEKMIRDVQLKSFPDGEPVGLLVLDHLTKMTRGNLTANLWDSLRSWLDHLTSELNLAVLLLHHNNYSGGVYGTSFIVNDANIHIHIDKQDVEDILTMNVTIPENRHGPSVTTPVIVEMFMGEKPSSLS